MSAWWRAAIPVLAKLRAHTGEALLVIVAEVVFTTVTTVLRTNQNGNHLLTNLQTRMSDFECV